MVSLIPALETILLSPLWGGLLDARGNGHRIILVSTLVQALGFTSLPFLSSPDQFVIVVSLTGVFTSSFIPVFSAIATRASQQYGRAIGGFWSAASLGFGSATLVGGVLYEFLGTRELFVLGAAYGYLGCVITILLSKEAFSSAKSTLGFGGYRRLLTQRNIITICTISLLAIIATSAFNSFFTLYLVDFLERVQAYGGIRSYRYNGSGSISFQVRRAAQ